MGGMTERCSEQVHARWTRWPTFNQCERKAVETVNGVHYCKQHSPSSRAKEEERQAVAWAQEDFKRTLEWHSRRYFEALLKIARGHNDPQTLAREILKQFLTQQEPADDPS